MKEKIFILINLLFLLLASHCFSYVNWDPTLGGQVSQLVYLSIFIIYFIIGRKYNHTSIPYQGIVWLLFAIPFLSTFSKVFIYSEPFYDLRTTHFPLVLFLSFFTFWSLNVKENTIIKVLTIFGFAIFAIQLVQILFPDIAVFGIYDPDSDAATWEDDVAEVRNGIHRYRIGSYAVTLVCMYYYWCRFLDNITPKRFLFFAIFFASMYFNLTRQIMAASLITLALSFLVRPSTFSQKIKYILGILIFGAIIYSYSDVLFGSLLEQTQDENYGQDNIRVLTYGFYWQQIIEKPLMLIIGHGYIHDIDYWQEFYKFFWSDIGIVGQWFLFGVLWIALYVYILILFIKNRKKVPSYILLYAFATFLCCPMIFPYTSSVSYYIWTCILYISSRSIIDAQQNNSKKNLSYVN